MEFEEDLLRRRERPRHLLGFFASGRRRRRACKLGGRQLGSASPSSSSPRSASSSGATGGFITKPGSGPSVFPASPPSPSRGVPAGGTPLGLRPRSVPPSTSFSKS